MFSTRTRERLIEIVAESDDALMEEYFENGTLPEEEIYPNLAKAIATSKLCPVYAVSATTLVGLSDPARPHRRIRAESRDARG